MGCLRVGGAARGEVQFSASRDFSSLLPYILFLALSGSIRLLALLLLT